MYTGHEIPPVVLVRIAFHTLSQEVSLWVDFLNGDLLRYPITVCLQLRTRQYGLL
jgi:hypothetical protein